VRAPPNFRTGPWPLKRAPDQRHLMKMQRRRNNLRSELLNPNIPKVLLSFVLGALIMLTGSLIYSKIQESKFQVQTRKSQPTQFVTTVRDIATNVPHVSWSEDSSKTQEPNSTTDASKVVLSRAPDSTNTHQTQAPELTGRRTQESNGGIHPALYGSDNRLPTVPPVLRSSVSTRVDTLPANIPQSGQQGLRSASEPQAGIATQSQYAARAVQESAVHPEDSPAVPPASRGDIPSSQAEAKIITAPPGTVVGVRLAESLSSDHTRTGEVFRATLDSPIVVNGFVIARAESVVLGRIVQASRAPLLGGRAHLTLALTNITLAEGNLVTVDSNVFEQQGSRSNIVNTAKMVTGAAVGATIGAVTGAAEGAGISSALRSSDRTSGFMATKRTVVLPAGTLISFTLSTPLTTPQRIDAHKAS
jgi:hypothetical protein